MPEDADLHSRSDRLIFEGNAQEDRGDYAAALHCYREAVNEAPRYPRAHLNVGNALRLLGQPDAAAIAFRQALALDPQFAHAHFNLGTLLATAGDRDGAKTALHEALRYAPGIAHKVNDAESYLLWVDALRGDLAPEASAREHMRVGAAIAAAAGSPFREWCNSRDPDRKLRVGYVSGDLATHPVALFLKPLLERHDRSNFAIHCYSNTGKQDAITELFRARCDGWHAIQDFADDRVAAIIRDEGIDLLVDLSGHTERNRLSLFARHPAPVQATWLGYLATSGLSAMDYRICDRYTDPEGEAERLHSESLIRLPYSQWCYTPWSDALPVYRPVPRPGPIVFASFNQFAKVSERSLDLWARILVRVPTGRIVVFDVRDDTARRSLVERFAQFGVDSARIDVRQRLAPADYYLAMADVDVALDTHPYNGATTTLDALWMSVPIVALRGERGVSRSTFSILSTLALPELIAHSDDDYVEVNVRLAQDSVWRGALRRTLRARLAGSPLMDVGRFTVDLETAYRRMWSSWCAAHPLA